MNDSAEQNQGKEPSLQDRGKEVVTDASREYTGKEITLRVILFLEKNSYTKLGV